jgi:uncharacterized protein affecting Mg2+/Co2+ transport
MAGISSWLQYMTKSALALYQIDHDSYRSVSSKESEERVLFKKKVAVFQLANSALILSARFWFIRRKLARM